MKNIEKRVGFIYSLGKSFLGPVSALHGTKQGNKVISTTDLVFPHEVWNREDRYSSNKP